jgi:hypothetical protein
MDKHGCVRNPLVASCLLLASCSAETRSLEGVAEREILTRRAKGLESLIAIAESGPLIRLDQVLVVVNGRLVQDLIAATLPVEGDVGGKYRIRLEHATVDFTDGLALVRLVGRGSVRGENLFVDVRLFGGLEIVELDPVSGLLRGRVDLFAVDVSRVSIEGLDRPARGLVNALSKQGLEALGALLPVAIPVRFERQILIPAAGPGEVQIAAAALQLEAKVLDVKAFQDKLWISIGASVATAPPAGVVAK